MSEDAVRIVGGEGDEPQKLRQLPRWVVVATLGVFVGSLMVFAIVSQSDTSPAGASGEGQVTTLYLATDIDDEQSQLIVETLSTLPGVIDWRYVTRTEAYEEALIRYADDEDALRILKNDPDSAPASIRLLVATVSEMMAIRAFAFKTFSVLGMTRIGGASGSGTLTDATFPIWLSRSPIEGGWLLESFGVGGVEVMVEPGVNAVRVPWIEIGAALGGNSGCNSFHGPPDGYSFADGVLIPGEVVVRAIGCNSPVEDVFIGMLWDHADGIDVEFTDGGMVWTAGDTRLVFISARALAQFPDGLSTSTQSPLDCSPSMVVRDSVLDTGQDPEELLRDASPDVVRVDPERVSWWWGYNDLDEVIVGARIKDVRSVSHTIYTCVDATP